MLLVKSLFQKPVIIYYSFNKLIRTSQLQCTKYLRALAFLHRIDCMWLLTKATIPNFTYNGILKGMCLQLYWNLQRQNKKQKTKTWAKEPDCTRNIFRTSLWCTSCCCTQTTPSTFKFKVEFFWFCKRTIRFWHQVGLYHINLWPAVIWLI